MSAGRQEGRPREVDLSGLAALRLEIARQLLLGPRPPLLALAIGDVSARAPGSTPLAQGTSDKGTSDENTPEDTPKLNDKLNDKLKDKGDAGPEIPLPEHQEVWRLVEQAQTGDGEAFGALYDRYVDQVYRFIYYRVHDRQLAEDLTSETFLRALRRISVITYQGRDLGAWFMTIARNIVFDHSKSARTRLEIVSESPSDDAARAEHAESPETAVLAMLSNDRLMAAVNELGDEPRECVLLRFIYGLSVAETAEIMNKTEGAIKAMQHRAIKRLADNIGGENL